MKSKNELIDEYLKLSIQACSALTVKVYIPFKQ